MPLLSLLIILPMLGAIGVIGVREAVAAKRVALWVSFASLGLCAILWQGFNPDVASLQFVESHAWIPVWHIRYALGVDGIAMPLIVLTSLMTLIVVLTAETVIKENRAHYFAAFLVLQGLMIGVFAATDAVLFYVFWEAMLIPMYLCIGMWGSDNRYYAAMKFFLYTFVGSALMLIALIYLGWKAQSFIITDFYRLPLSATAQGLLFIAFVLAFAVKVPMWPVHTWLPDAHTEAPAGGSVILAAILLKMGAYGLLRFVLPVLPDASQALSSVMIALSLVAVVYIGLVAIVQSDMKRLIAYSSISHMGFVTLAIFMSFTIVANTQDIDTAVMGLEGGMMQMISHGFTSGALFAIVGMLYAEMHSRKIQDYGGVVNTMPVLTSFMMLFAMANVGLPGTSGFVGEFLVILASIKANFWIAFIASSTVILSAAYTLWMFKRVFFGEVANQHVAALKDIKGCDRGALLLLAGLVLAVGVYPKPLLSVMQVSVHQVIQMSLISKLA